MNIKGIIKNYCPFVYDLYLERLIQKSLSESKRIHDMSDENLELYISDMYKDRIGRELDWNDLNTFTEKMQWAKIYDNDPRKVTCTDKYLVREYVTSKIGPDYLIPLLGVWNKAGNIRFRSLPEQFVLKTNHASGDVIPVRNNSELPEYEKKQIKWQLEYLNRTDYGTRSCEFHYSKISPKIIAEEMIGTGGDLLDYKFQCFSGQPEYCFVDSERTTDHRRNVYDLQWNLLPWNTGPYKNSLSPIKKPDKFEEMVEIVKALAEDFSQVRVDLYNVNGCIFFGEMTFTAASGLNPYTSHEADLALGQMWHADTSKRCRIDR